MKKRIFISIIALLIVARILLPWGIQRYVNHVLDKSPDYDGEVGDVDVHLWRGAYSIQDVQLIKTTGKVPVPFFKAGKVDFSIAWRELFQKQLVMRIELFNPEINFVDSEQEQGRQTGKGGSWGEMLEALVPFRISQFIVHSGALHFRKFQANPPVNLFIKDLQAELKNLTNSQKLSKNMFAQLTVQGNTIGGGRLQLAVDVNPYAKKSTFNLKAKLLDMQLKPLNAFFNEYANFDFEKGVATIVAEINADNGAVQGYVKPLFRDLDVVILEKEVKKDGDSIFRIVWEAIVGAVTTLFKNQPKDQFATKIPLEGNLKDPSVNVWSTIGGVLKNAFIQAFTPFYENARSLKKEKR